MTLTEFLLERIEDDQAAADCWHDLECDRHLVITATDAVMFSQVPGAFCDCNGPSRVLAECTAKRRIIEEHAGPAYIQQMNDRFGYGTCMICEDGPGYDRDSIDHKPLPCDTLRFLAAPYSSHPDFDAGWGTP